MTNLPSANTATPSANTTIVTRSIRAMDLIEERAAVSSPLENPIWVSDGNEHSEGKSARTTTSHLLVNLTAYDDDLGPHIILEFPGGIISRRVALDEVIEVHSIRPGRDLIEGVDPRPPMPPTRGAR
jgi:hypothetical protein